MVSRQPIDLSVQAGADQLVALALEHFGGIDILYNNAAMAYFAFVPDMDYETFNRTQREEVDIIFHLCRAAWPHLIARGGGSIINTASTASVRHYYGIPAYQTSKAGVIGLTINLAGDLGEKRIRVNAIAPGMVWTPMAASHMSPARRAEREKAGLIQEEGTAWDIGWAAVFLASDESRWISGQVLLVDAGVTLTTRGGTDGRR